MMTFQTVCISEPSTATSPTKEKVHRMTFPEVFNDAPT